MTPKMVEPPLTICGYLEKISGDSEERAMNLGAFIFNIPKFSQQHL
jgi:hypothetical protein